MVSKASEDLPEPDGPVTTVNVFRGISRLMFFRLCWRAPWMTIFWRPIIFAVESAPGACTAPSESFRGTCATFHSNKGSERGQGNRAGLQNRRPGPRRLAGRLPVFQAGGRDLNHEV